tara:strand:- start:20105 stop:20788 length:684 start_codon:yes stop_codon:yes gene_type:complete
MDVNKVISSLAGSGVLGGFAGGAVGGALMSSKKARKTAGTLAKAGGIAALGAIAWKAYQGYQSNRVAEGAVTGQAPGAAATRPQAPHWQGIPEARFALPDDASAPGSSALLLVQAMIAAACADGHMDMQERERILHRVDSLTLAPDEKALVFDALQAPLSLSQLCQRVDSPELAAEVYLSSVLAVDNSRSEARLYLDALAFRLGLPQGLVERLHEEVSVVTDQAAVT